MGYPGQGQTLFLVLKIGVKYLVHLLTIGGKYVPLAFEKVYRGKDLGFLKRGDKEFFGTKIS